MCREAVPCGKQADDLNWRRCSFRQFPEGNGTPPRHPVIHADTRVERVNAVSAVTMFGL